MKETKEFVCIACPVGCNLNVEIDGDEITVTGNNCKNGLAYGREEATNPKRIVPSTVVLEGGKLKRLPVKTNDAVPKGMIFDVMKEIDRVRVKAPVKLGDIIINDVCGTGVDVVATKSIDEIDY